MTRSTNIEIILQKWRSNLSPTFLTPVLRRLTKWLVSRFFASNCTHINNPNTISLFYLRKSILSFPILTLAPTYKFFRIFTLQTGKTMVGVKQKLLLEFSLYKLGKQSDRTPSNLVRPKNKCFGHAVLRIRGNKLQNPHHYRAALIIRGNIYITRTKLEEKKLPIFFFIFFF